MFPAARIEVGLQTDEQFWSTGAERDNGQSNDQWRHAKLDRDGGTSLDQPLGAEVQQHQTKNDPA